MSQQQERGDLQPNDVNPSLQPNPYNAPSHGSSEEPHLSQAQNIPGEHLIYYRPLVQAAQSGDWKSFKIFVDLDPNALTAIITPNTSQTVFHVAAERCQWKLVLQLLELIESPESLAVQDVDGWTVLHFVALGGSLKTAKALVKKNSDLLQVVDNSGDLPLIYSLFSDNKELMWYFTLLTRVESSSLPRILRALIASGYPDEIGSTLLWWLADEGRSLYFSMSNLGFMKRWIYKFVRVESKKSPEHLVMINMEDLLESTEGFPAPITSTQPRSFATQVLGWFKRLLWNAIVQLAPSIRTIWEAKLKHECAVELVNIICMQLSHMSYQQTEDFLQNPPILGKAVEVGIEEIVRILLQHFTDLLYCEPLPQRNLLDIAVENRQEKIVNIIKEISPTIARTLCARPAVSRNTIPLVAILISPTAARNLWGDLVESKNTTLHLAGKLAPAFKLYSVSGAALQMQRELQWFKEVEKITFPFLRECSNDDHETPKDVFKREHKELVDQGEKWTKDTANSSMLVSTLIATVLFAAAFTIPGGNINDKGIPIFLQTNAFMIFAISNAIGLFASLTSLLMFLAILTARYTVEDFLESLPKKLIIGLGSLFFAIAAMIIAFGATLTIVLSERWQWVAMPITLLASFPVAIFVMLQLPLFVQMVQSTYGSSMFRPWPSRL
ncbi:hypothetical protein ACOSQ2_020470 [Xanthoceras sorbifolium]